MAQFQGEKFIRNVENTISPGEIGRLFFFQEFKKLLPRRLFKKVLAKTSKETPLMGFVIDPYCLFLFYKIKNIERAKAFLPERYELVKSSIFEGDEPQYYYGFGCFNSRASTFWGTRLECYLVTRDKETGLLSFIFIDILSNTIIALPSVGIADPNCQKSIFTTNSNGKLLLDMREDATDRQIVLTGDVTRGTSRKLNQDLWLLGNTSIAHSKEFAGEDDNPFAVVFDPDEVSEALDLPVDSINIMKDSLYPDLAESQPDKVVCFPYTQHYMADSPSCRTYIRSREDMMIKYDEISELQDIETFSTKKIRKQFYAGIAASFLASMTFLVLLATDVLSFS